MAIWTAPTGYTRIHQVQSFDDLVTTPFAGGVNALCWSRTPPGDFGAVVALLGAGEGIVTLDDARLRTLSMQAARSMGEAGSAAARTAIEVLRADLQSLVAQERDPVLNCIYGYPRDEDPGPVSTDVFSFHADSAPVAADTWLCTYHGAPSEGLRNDQAHRRVDLHATRARLLERFGGEDNEDFHAYLKENCYDLHYAAAPEAQTFSFGLGNLWRIAVDWPGSPVPPCIHRAPSILPGQPARLLLIS